ncbi:pantetheine-phosphate adenylyltransferase [Anaerovibrio sp.]|uniref:pantetheine-phosphate adenylyltransferase n=1 Tax=Anaerovibrio sp. TaxID=1872532 RepID=UPI003F15B4D1
MRRAICPGSFDPVTLGHVDIFQRAAGIFDELYIGVFNNIRKTPLLSVEERMALLRRSVADMSNVKVVSFDGLLADYMLANDIKVIVRGLRSVTDFEYEQGQAQIIRAMHPELDTLFLLGRPEYNSYSSSVVREIIRFHGNYGGLVPDVVAEYLAGKASGEKNPV